MDDEKDELVLRLVAGAAGDEVLEDLEEYRRNLVALGYRCLQGRARQLVGGAQLFENLIQVHPTHDLQR